MPDGKMNPSWIRESRELAESGKKKPHSDVASGHRYRQKTLWLKSEVKYEHPAKNMANRCGLCIHFKSPHQCEIVAGYIRKEDWCDKFEERK
jgi:hypothetical protein